MEMKNRITWTFLSLGLLLYTAQVKTNETTNTTTATPVSTVSQNTTTTGISENKPTIKNEDSKTTHEPTSTVTKTAPTTIDKNNTTVNGVNKQFSTTAPVEATPKTTAKATPTAPVEATPKATAEATPKATAGAQANSTANTITSPTANSSVKPATGTTTNPTVTQDKVTSSHPSMIVTTATTVTMSESTSTYTKTNIIAGPGWTAPGTTKSTSHTITQTSTDSPTEVNSQFQASTSVVNSHNTNPSMTPFLGPQSSSKPPSTPNPTVVESSSAPAITSIQREDTTPPDTFFMDKTDKGDQNKPKLVKLCQMMMSHFDNANCSLTLMGLKDNVIVDSIVIGRVAPSVINQFLSEPRVNDNTTLVAILTSCGALLAMILGLAIYASYHRKPYRKNHQQHLTEELQTVENGYHDNPTLEVMEVHPEMQEKKVALNGEFNDSWIVPIDNLLNQDMVDEEDTHL